MIKDTSGQDHIVNTTQRKSKRWMMVTTLSLSVVALSGFIVNKYMDATPTVDAERLRIAEVKPGNLTRDISVTGKVVAGFSPVLYSSNEGTVSFKVKAGEQVEKGQVVAKIDSPELKNRLQQEQAILERLNIEV